MRKPRKTQPVTPPANSATAVTLKLEPDARLNVAIIQAEKPAAPLSRNLVILIVVFLLLAFAWGVLYLVYVQPVINTTDQPLSFTSPDLSVTVTHPGYATYQDELELILHITNRGAREFTGNVALVFAGGVPAYPLPGEAASVKLEKLAAGVAAAHRVKFALRQRPPFWSRGYQVFTQVRVLDDSGVLAWQNGPALAVAHIGLPLRTLNAWLSNSVLLAAVAALLWEVLRKRFFGWEAKG